MNEQETVEFLERQIDLEDQIVEKVKKNTSALGNMFVKNLLLGVAQDSTKHALLLTALKALVQKKDPMLNEAERDSIADGIQEHIKLEAQAVETYTQLVEGSGNSAVKRIAGIIREEEIAHHKLLVDLHKTLIGPQTLTEEDIWEMLWKDSPWHGSPGG